MIIIKVCLGVDEPPTSSQNFFITHSSKVPDNQQPTITLENASFSPEDGNIPSNQMET